MLLGSPSRFVVTDLFTQTTTWLDKLILSGAVAFNLNQPSTIDLSIRPNVRRVNGIYSDGFPRVAQSNRLIYMFLDEDGPPSPLTCRAAGVIMSPEDQGDPDVPTSHLVAYDPWQYLMARPCYEDTSGTLPGPAGFLFPATRGGVIVATLLKNAILSDGIGCFIDAGPSYGGFPKWTGVIEDTPIIDFRVQQGMSVGEAWNELLAAGQDPDGGPGGVDIVLTAVYDPSVRPGITHELSVYNLAGSEQPGAPMAWGEYTRTSSTADRQHDATPGAFINVANFHAGQGGPPAGPGGLPITNPLSIAAFQPYWSQQWFPDQLNAIAVRAMARQALNLQKQGKRTFVLNPDPVRARPPFKSYNLGDRIPVVAPRTLRVAATGMQRVQGIPLSINPDGYTRVNSLLTTPDWRGDDGT